ncbi:hypothetical protein [Virgibacillus sp. SK37]|uniref:hypothetical protein n=1 Tax=Virgibacillus sp. SK37 TaxID=403957 RepID=UPI0004D1A159|nr:hypothetical protein [Virgibacillus sp. SK37]AIF45556.1 hypothetical protein X953_16315 [Virgibacillus sp. SK37]
MNRIYESFRQMKFGSGKMWHFIVYTLAFANILNSIADKELTKLLNANNETIYTYNYSLGATGLIFLIPGALLSLLIVTILVKIRDRFFPNLSTYKVIVSLFNLTKLLLKAVRFLGNALFYIIIFIVAIFSDGGGRSSSGGGSYHSGGSSKNSSIRKNLKKEAEWKASQLQKDANYAYKHAGKQAQYNINSHHFDDRLNRANAKQREANEAAKRARNL